MLVKATGPIEVIAVLDGYWPDYSEIIEDSRVIYLNIPESRGMRNAINSGVAVSRGEYILKCDAHVMFEKGFDEVLKADCKENWVVVPRRYALDPEKWKVINNPKYPVDRMYLSTDLHGMPWVEANKDQLIEDTPSSQGSSWFMRKTYYEFLELLDEKSYGTFYNEFQEIGLKAWLSGGKVVVNKKTFYSHWHKPSDVGRGYSLDKGEKEKALAYLENWKKGKGWHKQIYSLSWFKDKFPGMPGW